jgi:hypothetical protein
MTRMGSNAVGDQDDKRKGISSYLRFTFRTIELRSTLIIKNSVTRHFCAGDCPFYPDYYIAQS